MPRDLIGIADCLFPLDPNPLGREGGFLPLEPICKSSRAENHSGISYKIHIYKIHFYLPNEYFIKCKPDCSPPVTVR